MISFNWDFVSFIYKHRKHFESSLIFIFITMACTTQNSSKKKPRKKKRKKKKPNFINSQLEGFFFSFPLILK